MPFTIAHPAIVLPLKKSKLFSLTALIAGSMVPDFEFFFQMREVENVGHHWYGILLFDFPAALLFCFLFHNLLRNSLVVNMPASFRNRFMAFFHFDWNNYAIKNKGKIAVSILTGILSHFFLDGFTHKDGMFVILMPFLSKNIRLDSLHMPVYFFLQILFSVAGILFVFNSVNKQPVLDSQETEVERNKLYWPLFSVILFTILFFRIIFWTQYNSFWGIFMAVMGGICYSWLLVSFFFKHSLQKNISL